MGAHCGASRPAAPHFLLYCDRRRMSEARSPHATAQRGVASGRWLAVIRHSNRTCPSHGVRVCTICSDVGHPPQRVIPWARLPNVGSLLVGVRSTLSGVIYARELRVERTPALKNCGFGGGGAAAFCGLWGGARLAVCSGRLAGVVIMPPPRTVGDTVRELFCCAAAWSTRPAGAFSLHGFAVEPSDSRELRRLDMASSTLSASGTCTASASAACCCNGFGTRPPRGFTELVLSVLSRRTASFWVC